MIVPEATEPLRDHLPLGGRGIAVTSRYLERDGVPILPVSAEVHFSRIPRSAWDDELRKIAASGVTVLASYAIWIHHEQVEGQLRFDGSLDLRAFVELCRMHGLDVFLRVGPWAHAEARNGGFPDWLLERELEPRSNDPRYLAEVRRWFAALAEQLAGLDLFAVQVENELYDDPEHLATLVDLARECGIDAPLWTGTAWGGAHLPADRMLPLYAGYSEAFWIAHDAGYDASSASNFYYSDERDEIGVGADTRDSALTPSNLDPSRYPYATCELGGGMVSAYHRRPTAHPDDVAALALTKLGSGSTWQGYYMFHDGINPAPAQQESHATGGRNDLPELSYDFGAPLGLMGESRASLGKLRLQHHFLRRFGDRLAPLPLVLPPDAPAIGDTTALRWAVRGSGERGFVFVTNHEPHATLPEHRGVVFDGFPTVDIPSGAYFFWPFGFEWAGGVIDWATAQIVTAIGDVLVVTGGPDARLSFDGVEVPLRERQNVDGFLLLSREDAERAQVVGGRLVLCDDVLTAEWLYAERERPELDEWNGERFVRRVREPGYPLPREVPVTALREAGMPAAVRLGPWERASAPTDWTGAGRWALDVSELPLREGLRVLVELDWVGDVARALVDGRPVDDRYFTGRSWTLPLDLLEGATEVTIEILSMDPDAPIYLPDDARVALGDGRAALRSARVRRVERR
ncbi:beta-galactosidase [Schumannella luteola]